MARCTSLPPLFPSLLTAVSNKLPTPNSYSINPLNACVKGKFTETGWLGCVRTQTHIHSSNRRDELQLDNGLTHQTDSNKDRRRKGGGKKKEKKETRIVL